MKRKCLAEGDKSRLCLIMIFAVSAALMSAAILHAAGYLKYPGDVNTDRQIDVSDGVLLARYCIEDKTVRIKDEGVENADVDEDGYVNGDDITYLLRMIVFQVPMSKNPYETEPRPNTSSAATATTSEMTQMTEAETTASAAETTVTSAETTLPAETETAPETTAEPQDAVLIADERTFPLGKSISVLSRDEQPNETLTVYYQNGNIIFAIFASDLKKTTVAFAYQDDIFGYYTLCSDYTVPEGYDVVEFRDKQKGDALYAVLVQKSGLSIAYPNLAEGVEMTVHGKLAYYATNGIRALNGLEGFIWDEELAKVAMLHSREMADHNFCEHESLDGTKFSDRLLNNGIDWQSCAENIDYGYRDPFSAVNGWYNSTKGHRNNLLHEKCTRIGVAFAYNPESDHLYYGTQDFYRGWE